MSRWLKLAMIDEDDNAVPFQFIANDGNFVVNPIDLTELDTQGTAERYDIIVDFSRFRIGDRLKLVNLMEHKDGRGPEGPVSLGEALSGQSRDPAVGAFMEFRLVDELESVDQPGHVYYASAHVDRSRVPVNLHRSKARRGKRADIRAFRIDEIDHDFFVLDQIIVEPVVISMLIGDR